MTDFNNLDYTTLILLVVLFSSVLGIFLVGVWLLRNAPFSRRQARISRFVGEISDDRQVTYNRDSAFALREDVGKFREWLNRSLGSFTSEKLEIKISSAYWEITATEFILLRILGTILALMIGWLLFDNLLAGVFLALLAIMIPPILLDRAITRRQDKFHKQLLDVLVLINGAVQAGYSLMQALDMAVREIPAPASEEFGRVLREVRLGLTLEAALNNLAERMENDDLQIVVTAIIINAQVGGNLSTILESTVATIRDRMALFGEIRALTSYARYVGNFLSLMPFITGLVIFFFSPGYFDTVKSSLLVQIMFIVALIGVVIGNIWIRRIVQIKV